MTSNQKIVFLLEGADKDGGHLELSVYAEKTRQFLDFLQTSAKESGIDSAVFHVVGLSHASPATMECVAIGQDSATFAAFNSVRENLNAVEGETRHLSHPVLAVLEKLAKFTPEKIARMKIATVGDSNEKPRICQLDDQFRDKLVHARSEEYCEVSTIDGVLEEINIHSKPHAFKIYAWAPAVAAVKCNFSPEILSQVRNALGAWVSVSGDCHNRPDATMPYKIDVHEIEVLPPANELPSMSDLLGIAPGATGDNTSEQFVRKLREQWDK